MIIITSPAKTLDFGPNWSADTITKPQFLSKSAVLAEELQKLSKKKLRSLMKVSEDIAELNYYRFKHWQKRHDESSSKPAILAYKGDIYRQFDASGFDKKDQKYLQDSLRIITGLYGLLRPYDLIQPYRLEMKIKLKTEKSEDLYEFWGDTLTKNIIEDLGPRGILINLASDEYAKAIKFEKIKNKVYQIEFRQKKGKEEFNHGIYAKKARGLMINFMTANKIKTIEKLKEFDLDGYKYKSEDTNSLIFIKKI